MANAPKSQYLRELVTLAFLAPQLQARVLAGAIPARLTVAALAKRPMPLAWADQAEWFNSAR